MSEQIGTHGTNGGATAKEHKAPSASFNSLAKEIEQ
jgi:hypothetical protein